MNHSNTADHSSVPMAIALITSGYFAYNVSDALNKYLAQSYSIFEIMFFYGFFGLVFILPVAWFRKGKEAFKSKNYKKHTLRAVILLGSAASNVYALKTLTLTSFYTVMFLSPLIVTMLVAFFLKEHVGLRRWVAIGLGFLTILYMFRPGGELLSVAGLFMLFSATCFSSGMVIVRSMPKDEPRELFAISFQIGVLIFGGVMMMSEFVMPQSLFHWGVFFALGMTSSLGTLLTSAAFQVSPSSAIVAPFHYSQIIWGALIGYFIFADIPSGEVMIGAGILIALGLFILYAESKGGKKKVQRLR